MKTINLIFILLALTSCQKDEVIIPENLDPPRVIVSRQTTVWNGTQAGRGDELQVDRVRLYSGGVIIYDTITATAPRLIADCGNDLNTFHRETTRYLNNLGLNGKFIFHTGLNYFSYANTIHTQYISIDEVAQVTILRNGAIIMEQFNEQTYSDTCAFIVPYNEINLIEIIGYGGAVCDYDRFEMCINQPPQIIEQFDSSAHTRGDFFPNGIHAQSWRTTMNGEKHFFVNVDSY